MNQTTNKDLSFLTFSTPTLSEAVELMDSFTGAGMRTNFPAPVGCDCCEDGIAGFDLDVATDNIELADSIYEAHCTVVNAMC